MSAQKIMFSVNEYDKDGDPITDGIFLHIGDVRIRTGNSLADFDAFVTQLQQIRSEVTENYPDEEKRRTFQDGRISYMGFSYGISTEDGRNSLRAAIRANGHD